MMMNKESSKVRCVYSILQINDKDYPLYEGVNIIGRNRTAAVPIKNLNVSQYHAIITIVDTNNHYLSDLQTCNGTLLENDRLEPLRLYEIEDAANIQFASVTAVYKKVSRNSINISNLNKNDETSSQDTQSIYGEETQPIEDISTKNLKCPSSTNIQNYFDDDYNFADISTQALYSKKYHDSQQPSTSAASNTILSINELPTQICSYSNTYNESNIHEMETQIIVNEDKEIEHACDVNNTSIQIIHNNNKNAMDVLNSSSIQSNIEIKKNESLSKFNEETEETLIIDESIIDNSIINTTQAENMPNLEFSPLNMVSSLNSDTQFNFNIKLLKRRNHKPISDSEEDDPVNTDSNDKTEQVSDNDKNAQLSTLNNLQNKDEILDSDTDIDEETCTMLKEYKNRDGENEKKIETNNNSKNSNYNTNNILNDKLSNIEKNTDNVVIVNNDSTVNENSDFETNMDDVDFAMEIEIESDKDITHVNHDAQSNIEMTCVNKTTVINSDSETDLDDTEEVIIQTKENKDDNKSTNIENKNCKINYTNKIANINSDSDTEAEDVINAQIESKTSDPNKNNSLNSDSETDSDLELDGVKKQISVSYSTNVLKEDNSDNEDYIIPASQNSDNDSEDDFNFASVKCFDTTPQILKESHEMLDEFNLNKNILNHNDNIIEKTDITKYVNPSVNNDNTDGSLTATNKDVLVTVTNTTTVSPEETSSLQSIHNTDTDSEFTQSHKIPSPKIDTTEDNSSNKSQFIKVSDKIFKKPDEDIFLQETQPIETIISNTTLNNNKFTFAKSIQEVDSYNSSNQEEEVEDIFLPPTQPILVSKIPTDNSTCEQRHMTSKYLRNKESDKEDMFLQPTQPIILTEVCSNKTSHIEDIFLQPTQPIHISTDPMNKEISNEDKDLNSSIQNDTITDDIFLQPTQQIEVTNVSFYKETAREDIFLQSTQPVITFDASLNKSTHDKIEIVNLIDTEVIEISSNKTTSKEDACLESTQPVITFDASSTKSTCRKNKIVHSIKPNEDSNVSLNKTASEEDIFFKSTQPVVTFDATLSKRMQSKNKALNSTDVEITNVSSNKTNPKEDAFLQSTRPIVTFDTSLTTDCKKKALHLIEANKDSSVCSNKTLEEDIFLPSTQPICYVIDYSLKQNISKCNEDHLNESEYKSTKNKPKPVTRASAKQVDCNQDILNSEKCEAIAKKIPVANIQTSPTKNNTNDCTTEIQPVLSEITASSNNQSKTFKIEEQLESMFASQSIKPKSSLSSVQNSIEAEEKEPKNQFEVSFATETLKLNTYDLKSSTPLINILDSQNNLEESNISSETCSTNDEKTDVPKNKYNFRSNTKSNKTPKTKNNQDNLNESEKSNVIYKPTKNKHKPVTRVAVKKEERNQDILNTEKYGITVNKTTPIDSIQASSTINNANVCTTEIQSVVSEITTSSNNQSKSLEIEDQLESMFASQKITSIPSSSLVQKSVEAEEKEPESQFEVSFNTQTLNLNKYNDCRPSNPLISILDSQNDLEESNTSLETHSKNDKEADIPKNKYNSHSNTNSSQIKHKAVEKANETTNHIKGSQVNVICSLKTKKDNYKETGRSTRSKRKINQSKDEFIDNENKSKQIKSIQYDIPNESSNKNLSTIKTRSNKNEIDITSTNSKVNKASPLLQSIEDVDKAEICDTKKTKSELSKPSNAKNLNSTKMENKSWTEKKSNKTLNTTESEVEPINLNSRSTRSKKVDQERVSDIKNVDKETKVSNSNMNANQGEQSNNSNSSNCVFENTPKRTRTKRNILVNKKEVVTPKKRKINESSFENEDKSICTATKQNEVLNVTMDTPTRNRRKQKPKVVFTMLDSPELESAIRSLGGLIVDSVESCTVLVTGSLKRSQKLLSAVGQGKPICSPYWIQQCKKANNFLDPWDFILEDVEAEQKWQFSLKESLNRSSNKKLLENIMALILVTNANDVLKAAIESCGGKCVTKLPFAKPADKQIIVVANSENKGKYSKYLKQKPPLTVVLPEAIFDGVLRQELQLEKHLLS